MDMDFQTLPPVDAPSPDVPQAILDLAPNFTIPDPMSAPALKWGIIGTGAIASTFAEQIPAYSTGNIVAVGSRRIRTAQAFAQRFSIDQAFGSYQELVQCPDVEAVYVATPHVFHYDHALAAVRAGKPVLVEKPFTINRGQAEAVLALARERGVFVMEAMWMRFLPHQLLAREILATGSLGEIVHIQADHGQKLDGIERLEDPALGGGALLDLGVYPVSFIQSILGAPGMVDAVGLVNRAGVDEVNVLALTYPGAIAVATSNMRSRSATAAQVLCRRGRLEIRDQFYQPGRIMVYRESGDGDAALGADGEAWTWDGHVIGGYQFEAAEVARCVNAGLTQSETMSWADTVEVMGIMDAARAQLGLRYPGE